MQLIKGGPDRFLAGFDRYTIQAKAEDPAKTTEAQLLEMLQTLLVDRFKLKFHRETEQRQGFRLVIGKNGSKMQAAKSEEVTTSFGGALKPGPGGPVDLTARRYSMGALADRTGLTGEYDFKLSWNEAEGPALTTAVQEQLGLKLEAEKVPVSIFAIDSAAKPVED